VACLIIHKRSLCMTLTYSWINSCMSNNNSNNSSDDGGCHGSGSHCVIINSACLLIFWFVNKITEKVTDGFG